jgi:hypothetical protein
MKREAYFRAFTQPERKRRLLSMAKNKEEIRQTLDALGDFLYRACCGLSETQNAEKPGF